MMHSTMKIFLYIACLSTMHAMKPNVGFLNQMKSRNTDPMCRTGVLSIPETDDEAQVCCSGFCGECSDHQFCDKAMHVDTDTSNECCLTVVKAAACGGDTPADTCIQGCSKSAPPCIMDAHAPTIPETGIVDAGKDCNEAIYNWRKKSEAAIVDGENNGQRILAETNTKRMQAIEAKHEEDVEQFETATKTCPAVMTDSELLVKGFKSATNHVKFRSVKAMMQEIRDNWKQHLNQSKVAFEAVTAANTTLHSLFADVTQLEQAEEAARSMAKAFHESERDCKVLQKFYEEHEAHWVLEHVRTHIDAHVVSIWNPMPAWMLKKIGCDADTSDGCGDGVPLMYCPFAKSDDVLKKAGAYQIEISQEGDHPKSVQAAAEECKSLCELDHSCMGGDVLAPPEGVTLQCNLFAALEGVAVSTDAKDVEGWFDRGFMKKAYYEARADVTEFTRGWTQCAWATDKADCVVEKPYDKAYEYYQ